MSKNIDTSIDSTNQTYLKNSNWISHALVVLGLIGMIVVPIGVVWFSPKIFSLQARAQQVFDRQQTVSSELHAMEDRLGQWKKDGETLSAQKSLLKRIDVVLGVPEGTRTFTEQVEYLRTQVEEGLVSGSNGQTERLQQTIRILKNETDTALENAADKLRYRKQLVWWLIRSFLGAGIFVSVGLGWKIYRMIHSMQDDIQQAEGYANEIVENIPDGVVQFNVDGEIVRINPAVERLLGFPAQQLIRRSIDDFVPHLLQTARSRFRTISNIGKKTHSTDQREVPLTLTANKAEGGTIPVSVRLNSIRARGVRHYIASLRRIDLTSTATDPLGCAVASFSGWTGSTYLKMLADAASRVMGCPYVAIVDISDAQSENIYRTTVLLENGHRFSRESFRYQGSFVESLPVTGHYFFAKRISKKFPGDPLLKRWNASGIYALALKQTEGTRAQGYLIVADRQPMQEVNIPYETEIRISQRGAVELSNRMRFLQLIEEKESLALTLRSIGDGMITTDPSGRVMMINPSGERLIGLSELEVIGQNLRDVFKTKNEMTHAVLPDPLKQLEETGSMTSVTTVLLVSMYGKETAVQYNIAPVQALDESIVGYVLIFHDLTEARIADEERYRAERLESVGRLAGGIAHDFNNLLTGIIGNISLVLSKIQDDASLQNRLRDAENASLRAKELSTQLLTFSKGGARVRRPTSLGKLIKETTRFSVSDTSIKCIAEVDEELWMVESDESQITQVLSNLIVNAQQAMESGQEVRVTAGNFKYAGEDANINLPPGCYVRISVEDEGSGIPPKYLKRIFDPYFTTKPKGSGLGLATSYSIINNHGGLMTVHSVVGEGTRFDIYLPSMDAESAKKPAAAEQQAKVEAYTERPNLHIVRSGRILVMDDEEIICDLVEQSLSPIGITVESRHDSATALAAYKEALEGNRRYDAVILDLTLPGDMGGDAVMQELLKMDPNVKAIVSSGYASTPIMTDWESYGFSGMLPKPYRVAELISTVQGVLVDTKSTNRVA